MIQPLKNEPSVWTLCWVDLNDPLPVEGDFFLPTILLLVGPEFEPLAAPEICFELDQIHAEEWIARVFDDLGCPDQLLVWKADEWNLADWKLFGNDWKVKIKFVKSLPHEAQLISQLGTARKDASSKVEEALKSQMSAGLVRHVSRIRSLRKRRATLEQAVTLDSANDAAWVEIAEIEFHAGNYQRSLEIATFVEEMGARLLQQQDIPWLDNPKLRPLMRALFGKMLCQWHLGNISEAYNAGRFLLEHCMEDPFGVRFYMPLFLLLNDDNEGASLFFRSYAQHYPKDMPHAWLSFAWAFTLGLEGDDVRARKKYREGMLTNIYIAPRLLDERPPPEDIFRPNERDDILSALEFIGSFSSLWDREASAMRALREAYEEIRPAIDRLVTHRAAMMNFMDQRYDPEHRAKWTAMLQADEALTKEILGTTDA